MLLFKVSVHGKDFPGAILGKSERVGFFTTRFVEAASQAEAEQATLALLHADPALSVAPEHRTREATVFVESIVEVPMWTERKPSAGFSFYVMGT